MINFIANILVLLENKQVQGRKCFLLRKKTRRIMSLENFLFFLYEKRYRVSRISLLLPKIERLFDFGKINNIFKSSEL